MLPSLQLVPWVPICMPTRFGALQITMSHGSDISINEDVTGSGTNETVASATTSLPGALSDRGAAPLQVQVHARRLPPVCSCRKAVLLKLLALLLVSTCSATSVQVQCRTIPPFLLVY